MNEHAPSSDPDPADVPDEKIDEEPDSDTIDPLEGLMDPDSGISSAAADADAPAPPG